MASLDLDRVSDALVHEEAGKRRLALASFLESTIVPIPLETLVVPLMVANPERAWRIAHAIFAGCLVGALMFYVLGNLLYEPVIEPAIETLGLTETFQETRQRLDESGLFWAVFLISLAPLPFQLATLGAGTMGENVVVFMAAVALSRGIRYYGLAFLAERFGARILELAGGRRQALVSGVVLLVALWLLAQLVR
ncbi:MAG: YqaA family protein [Paracoccaceae bacterium]